MPKKQRKGGSNENKWVEKNSSATHSVVPMKEEGISRLADAGVTSRFSSLSVAENSGQSSDTRLQFGSVGVVNPVPVAAPGGCWMPKSYGTTSASSQVEFQKAPACEAPAGLQINESDKGSVKRSNSVLSKLFKGKLVDNFSVDNSTYSQAMIRATFYPKFENEKSDQEVRTQIIEMVSKGLAVMEVSLKHSGSLFMYAGHEGGAYAKNSYGNIFTAVGVFVLGRMLCESWGAQASKKQAEFNDFLERNRICVSMELVTAVLGDHGQRPRTDYVVVTAVTELGNGKPKFYSTPDVIAFCRKWRLPTNHVWLFSTRKSVSSFFAAYDALCEEGTATSVCKALDEIANVSIPGSQDHVEAQGEILEGLVARTVSHGSPKQMEQVLRDFPPPPQDGDGMASHPSLREICASNRFDKKQQMKALLQSVGTSFCPNQLDWFGDESFDVDSRNADSSVLTKFLQANPADYSTRKLQEMIRLMKEKRFPAAFKCYHNFQKVNCASYQNFHFKMVIHVHSDSTFRRYQKERRYKPELWPLYRGFFVDLKLFQRNEEKTSEFAKQIDDAKSADNSNRTSEVEDLANEDATLMVKLKFLTYKLRTFLIRNGLPILFKDGPAAYKGYYLRQMKIWNTSPEKQREMSKMLDEWAVHICRKCGNKQLSSSVYLNEAEPFLEQYAKRSGQNQVLIGSAGGVVGTDDFLAIFKEGIDEEDDLEPEKGAAQLSPSLPIKDSVTKNEGLIVFFPGIPGCAKSALCKAILNRPESLGDDRPVDSLMGDLVKGRYWQKIADERKKKPYSIMLADKNAPNEEVWTQIERMCRSTKASAVPVIPESEGTETNPFALDALAVFMFRVLRRENHPGSLDKSSPNAGYVLLMFYHLYEGKNQREFETELIERFGSIVKMPLLQPSRPPLPDSVKSVIEEGINLYSLHTKRHFRSDSTKGTYTKEWAKWEKQLRETLHGNSEHLNSIQVPFESAVSSVVDQLKAIAKGEYSTPSTEKRKFGSIVYAAVTLPVAEIHGLLHGLAEKHPQIDAFMKEKDMEKSLTKSHVTLAHKRSHGVAAVASYGSYLHQNVPVDMTALLFTDTLAALDVRLGSVDGEDITSRNEWPHVTLWTAAGVKPQEANRLPQLLSEGKASRVEIDPPIRLIGILEFF